MGSSIKENANPQLFSVENPDRYSHTRRAPLEWGALGSFRQEGGQEPSSGNSVVPTTVEDKAILRALMDASRSTARGKGVGLLRKAGLVIPAYTSAASKKRVPTATSWCCNSSRPVFQIIEDDNAATNTDSETTPPVDESSSEENNDPICAEEIFDIIRTIQDPEHPNSLEQLGVVSLEQVELSLAKDRKEKTNKNQDEISIRFTPTIPVSNTRTHSR